MRALVDEGRAYRLSRSNMLLVGPDARVDALITAVTGLPATAIPTWTSSAAALSADSVPETLLVRDVHLLDAGQQARLHRALDVWQGRVRLIATAPASVYPLVSRRLFHEALYYRLNMLCLEPRAAEVSAERL